MATDNRSRAPVPLKTALLLNLDFMMLPKMLSTETVEGSTMLKHMNLGNGKV